MSVTAPNAPLRYRGFNSQYVDVAVRGAEEHLGLSIEYAVHPSGIGCFILRFIAHGKGINPKNFTFLTYREPAKFLIAATETTSAEVFKGVRLTKIAIPVFQPSVHRHELDAFATKHGVWPLLTAWLAQQIAAEGFTVTVPDLEAEVRNLLALPVTPDNVACILEFPKLDAPEIKAAALKLVQKPEPDEDEESDDDEDYTVN